jgi:capsular polysaccharide transport system ATP-binding protein
MTIELRAVQKVYKTHHGPASILNDVNLVVGHGEHVGILGQNGAGKSTLIRILGGSEQPTSGIVVRNMSVSWPLAFGGAFLGGLTGVDNVRFVCRLYGINPNEKIAFVEEFAELGRYMREPVKTYSSGMRARLAFAVSMAIDFDCYLVDEIIAVGDDRFQRKCQYELFEKRRDKALLIVSHSADFVRRHCQRASVLAGGRLENFDDVEGAYRFYSNHEVAIQAHMADEKSRTVVYLMPDAVDQFAKRFTEAGTPDEFGEFLDSAQLDRVPIFDSCDVVGRLENAGHGAAALAVADYLTKAVPTEPLFWVTLGDLLCKRRQHVPGVKAYESALQLDAESYWARRNLATELFNVGRYADAIPHYEKAIKLAPHDTASLELLLRWIDCHFLIDREKGIALPAALPSGRCLVVDTSGIAFSKGGPARFSVGGILNEVAESPDVRCVFRIGDLVVEGSPTFARNSVRRLSGIAKVRDFAFLAYALVPDGHGSFEIEINQGDETLYIGTHPVVTENTGIEFTDDPLTCARQGDAEHQPQFSSFCYGLGEQRGISADIVAFAENLIALGFYDEAEFRLSTWLKSQGNQGPDLDFVVDLLCSELARSRVPGWRHVVRDVLERSERLGARGSVLINQGHESVADGDIGRAAQLYREASAATAGQRLIHFARGIHTAQYALDVPFPGVQTGERLKAPKADIVHLFACDGGYFRRFAQKLVTSSIAGADSARILVHAHVVDPDEETRALAEQLRVSHNLQCTWEDSPSHIQDDQIRRAYFTCARFLAAPNLLRHYRCPLLITETDCLINWKWPDLLSHIDGADVGYVHSSEWNWVPWTKVPAGIYLCSATAAGIAWSDYVAAFIEHAFRERGGGATDLWTVDQVALWLAHMNGRGTTKRVHLPMTSVLSLATGDKLNI